MRPACRIARRTACARPAPPSPPKTAATDRQLMALYDWTSAKQANVYTAAADRKRLAGEAAKLVAGENEAGKSKVPLDSPTFDKPMENKRKLR